MMHACLQAVLELKYLIRIAIGLEYGLIGGTKALAQLVVTPVSQGSHVWSMHNHYDHHHIMILIIIFSYY